MFDVSVERCPKVDVAILFRFSVLVAQELVVKTWPKTWFSGLKTGILTRGYEKCGVFLFYLSSHHLI